MTIYSLDVLLSQFGTSLLFMSSSKCCFLTWIQVSQDAGKVVWYSYLLMSFPQFVVTHTVKGFPIGRGISYWKGHIFIINPEKMKRNSRLNLQYGITESNRRGIWVVPFDWWSCRMGDHYFKKNKNSNLYNAEHQIVSKIIKSISKLKLLIPFLITSNQTGVGTSI